MKNIGSSGRLSTEESEDEDISRLAISTFQAKEEEIERRKMAVKEKVELQLGRAEEETRRLAQIWDVSVFFYLKGTLNSLNFLTITEFWSYEKGKRNVISLNLNFSLNSWSKLLFICLLSHNLLGAGSTFRSYEKRSGSCT